MFDTVVLAVDGSESGERAVSVGLDLAERMDATVHAVSVVDTGEIEGAPAELEEDLAGALETTAADAVAAVEARASMPVTTSVQSGHPAPAICSYVRDVDGDVVVLGTRGRHGENRLLVGSVAERVLETAPVPVLTVRHLSTAG